MSLHRVVISATILRAEAVQYEVGHSRFFATHLQGRGVGEALVPPGPWATARIDGKDEVVERPHNRLPGNHEFIIPGALFKSLVVEGLGTVCVCDDEFKANFKPEKIRSVTDSFADAPDELVRMRDLASSLQLWASPVQGCNPCDGEVR